MSEDLSHVYMRSTEDSEKTLRQAEKEKIAARVKDSEKKVVTASASDKREALKDRVDSKLSSFEKAVATANKAGLVASLDGKDRRRVFLEELAKFNATGVIRLS